MTAITPGGQKVARCYSHPPCTLMFGLVPGTGFQIFLYIIYTGGGRYKVQGGNFGKIRYNARIWAVPYNAPPVIYVAVRRIGVKDFISS